MASNLDEKIRFCGYGRGHWRAERANSYLTPDLLDLFLCEFLSFFFHLRVDLVDVVVEVLEDHVELLGDEEDLF